MATIALISWCSGSPDCTLKRSFECVGMYWSSDPGHRFKFFLYDGWRQSIVELMRPLPVVPVHQIMADIPLRFMHGGVAQPRYPFTLLATEESFHGRIDAPMS